MLKSISNSGGIGPTDSQKIYERDLGNYDNT